MGSNEPRDIFDRLMALPLLRLFEPFYKKHKEALLYLFFGGLTTVISIAAFWLFRRPFGLNELIANVISWVIAVLFAFFTNRTWVFRAPTRSAGEFLRQMGSFFGGRVVTLLIEEALLAVFSLLGLAISLSVQNLLGNLVSGVVLLMNKPIRTGDYIQAGDAEGVVKDVGLFYTELTTLDNKTVSVPNSDLSAAKIVNFTREDNRRVDLVVGASYDCDTEDVKKALYDAIARTDKVLDDPAPQVLVEEFGASVIKYTVRAWCRHEDYWDVHYGINDNVLAAFKDAGVKMSYEHVNVHMVQD